jgi:hypothetical protein
MAIDRHTKAASAIAPVAGREKRYLLGCGLGVKSIPQNIGCSNHQRAILLKSPSIAFGIREALDLREQGAKGVVACALEPVMGKQVTQYVARHPTIDGLPVAPALK